MAAAALGHVVNGLGGFSVSHTFNFDKAREGEIRQGGNHFMAGLSQAPQINTVANLFNQMADQIPYDAVRVPLQIGFTVTPFVSWLPLGLILGPIRQYGWAETLAKVQNYGPKITQVLTEATSIPLTWINNLIDL